MTALALLLLAALSLGVLLFVVRAAVYRYPAPAIETAFLTRKEQAIVAAFADGLFPAGGPISLSGTEVGLVVYMDVYVRRSPARARALIRLLFAFIEHGPWLFGPRRKRFTRLSPAERTEALVDMARSRIYFRRIAFLSMRMMLSMGYLANDAVARQIGVRHDISPFEAPAPVSAMTEPGAERTCPPSVPPPGVAA